MDPEDVLSKADLVRFLAQMSARVDSFDNQDLGEFLESASGWLADMDGYFKNRGEPLPENPNWSLFASIIAAGAIYE